MRDEGGEARWPVTATRCKKSVSVDALAPIRGRRRVQAASYHHSTTKDICLHWVVSKDVLIRQSPTTGEHYETVTGTNSTPTDLIHSLIVWTVRGSLSHLQFLEHSQSECIHALG